MRSHFFRVDGADQETGEETYLVLEAESKPQAERLARKQGLLISSVRVAKPADWQGAAVQPHASPFQIETEVAGEPVSAVQTEVAPEGQIEADPAIEDEPPLPPQTWVSVEEESVPATERIPAQEPAANLESSQEIEEPELNRVAQMPDAPGVRNDPAPAPAVKPPGKSSSAPAIVLACTGGALLVAGAAAIALALWPDNAVRNELQQLDYRLQQLGQIVLGSMLVIAATGVFVISAMTYLLPRCKRES